MKKLVFFIVLVVIIFGIILVGLPWGIITSRYYKYRASKEPDKYSQCVNKTCRKWNAHKYMHDIGDGQTCDGHRRYEWWIKTETGEEYLGPYKEGD